MNYLGRYPMRLQSESLKQQKLIECVLTGNSKQYLGKACTEEEVNKLSAEEVGKLFSNYVAKLSGQMIKFLGKLIIMQVSISSKTTPLSWGQTPGTRLEGSKTVPPRQSLCTKTLPSGQNRESKAPPPGHKVRKFHKYIYKL